MPEPLVDILADKLSSDSGEVSELLEDYVSSLKRRLRSEENIHIDFFGEFSARGGQIDFAPDPTLSKLVNYRYEGLDAFPGGTWLQSKGVPGIPEREAVEEVRSEARKETDRVAIPIEKPAVVGTEDRGVRWTFVLIPIFVLAAAAVTFFVLRSGLLRPEMETPGPSNNARVESGVPSGASGLERSTDTDRAASIASVDSIRSDNPAKSDERQMPGAAAGGETAVPVGSATENPDRAPDVAHRFTRDTSGYTLVVGRAGTAEAAARRIQRFTPLGLPLAVVEYEEGGVRGYRLAVGQFSTLDDARRSLNDHADRLPDGTWIRRIRLLFTN